jgi:hypothetical protein
MKLDATTGGSRPSERMKQLNSAATAGTVSNQAPMHRVIYDALLAEIQQGQYRTGDRLPSELERMATSEWKFSVLPPWHEKGGEHCARLLSGTFHPYLELDAHRELELTWFCARRLTGNEHRALVYVDGGCISARVAGIDVIERVISVQAECYE